MATKTKKVTIYSTPTCVYCEMAKDFFTENGIKYENFDVAADVVKRKEMMEKSGQLGVPVITVDDDLLVGFDEDRLKELLGVK
ncbi:MAG TPA: glutaredoxin family protein [Candidatus Paceibacterota bacterium]